MTNAELQIAIDAIRNATADGSVTNVMEADIMDALKSNNIPLSGTTEGNPVTGPIEMTTGLTFTDNDLVTKEYVDAQRPYKVYTALLTQSGTNAPVATVLENTLVNIVLTRNGPGQYQSQILGFPLNKVWVYLKSSVPEAKETNIIYISSRIFIQTYTLNASHIISSVDDKLNNTPLEIRVYN